MFVYYIWQLPVSDPRCFLPVDYIEVDLSDYVHVYTFNSEQEIELEEVYTMLNDEYKIPSDYHARSLSTSDLILLENTEEYGITGYVVDIVGFKKIKINNKGK